jgi:hypothetical protein
MMGSDVDLDMDEMRIGPDARLPVGTKVREVSTRPKRKEFLHFDDLTPLKEAARLPGKSLIVFMLIKHRSRSTGSNSLLKNL